jgi:hypothetical protein
MDFKCDLSHSKIMKIPQKTKRRLIISDKNKHNLDNLKKPLNRKIKAFVKLIFHLMV